MNDLSSVKILHASDLHISTHGDLRSPLDQFSDLENPWDLSGKGVIEKGKILKNLGLSWWRRLAASSYDPEILDSLAEFIYNNAKRTVDGGTSQEGEGLDAVILTGDLATTGIDDDINKVKQFLSASYDAECPQRSVEEFYTGATLSALDIPVIYLPGNHDRYIPTREWHKKKWPIFFYPGATEFDEILSDHRADPIRSFELVSDDKKLKVIVFTADFTLEHFDDHEGLYGWLAQGRAYSNLRKNLVQATNKASQTKKDGQALCILWAVHFPPGYPVKKSCSLLMETELIKLANRTGVYGILGGHTHRQLIYRTPAMSFTGLCCGTTTQSEPMRDHSRLGLDQLDLSKGNHFQILTISVDETGQVRGIPHQYRYSAADPDNGPSLKEWKEVP